MAVLRQFIKQRQEDVASGKLKTRPPKAAQLAQDTSADNRNEGNSEVAHEKATFDANGAGGIRILEGLAASGLRAIRYALEVRISSKALPDSSKITSRGAFGVGILDHSSLMG